MGIIGLGIICLLIGLIAGINILWWIGIILLVVGLVLFLVPGYRASSRSRHYWY